MMGPFFFRMKNGILALMAVPVAVSAFCSGCTFIYSYPPPKSPVGPGVVGAIAYEVHDRYHDSYPRVHDSLRHSLFEDAVKQALHDSGYDDQFPLTEEDAATQNIPRLRLNVDVEVLSTFYDYGHAAAPQEWLTGMSLGLIPSWSTRHALKITFELVDGKTLVRRWENMPKMLWVNHLIFFPIAVFHIDSESDYRRQAAQLAAATRYFVATPSLSVSSTGEQR
jgi:hypothetical protein